MSKETNNKIVPKLRFPEFKDSKGWDIIPLGSAVKSESSMLAQNNLQLVEDGFPVYGASGLIGFTSSFIQDEDYIAIIKDGSGVGKLFLYEKQSSILGTLTYLKSKNTETYYLNYLFYLLQTINLSSFIKGSGIPHIYYSDYSKELFAVPAFKEQQKIASCLSSLDDLIKAQNQKLEALKEHKKGSMQQLFPAEGETVPKLRFPEFRDSGDWEEKKLAELLQFKNGINASKELYGKGVKFINVLDILQNEFINYEKIIGSVDVSEEMANNFSVSYGDIIFQRSSETQEEVGTANVYLDMEQTATFGGFIIRGKKIGEYDPIFLNKLLKTTPIRNSICSKAGGSTRFNIGQEILSSIEVLLPSLNEQQKIACCLSSLDELITSQTEKIEALKEHKKGLMQGLFPSNL